MFLGPEFLPFPARGEVRGQVRSAIVGWGLTTRVMNLIKPGPPTPPPLQPAGTGTGTVLVLFLKLYQNRTPDRSCVRLFRCFFIDCIFMRVSVTPKTQHYPTPFFSILCKGREGRAQIMPHSILSRSARFLLSSKATDLCHVIIRLAENPTSK